MTNDAHLFRTLEEFQQSSYDYRGNIFSKGNDIWLPLYEAKLAAQYNHRHATFDGIPRVDRFKIHAGTNLATLQKMIDPDWTPMPRYWVSQENIKDVYSDRWQYSWWIGFRNAISAVADARSIVFSVLPKFGVGNSFPLIFTTKNSLETSCLLSNMNTLVLDYVARQKVSGGNLNFFIIKQLPGIPPHVYNNSLLTHIIPKVLELVSCSWDIQSFTESIWTQANPALRAAILRQWDDNNAATGGSLTSASRPDWAEPAAPDSFPRPPFKWDEDRRAQLRAELDGLFAHLYGLTRDEFAYILDTFPIVRRKDEARYGEYRTKRLCLEAYDAIADRPDFEDLIPEQARRLQQQSVLGAESQTAPATSPSRAAPLQAAPAAPTPARPIIPEAKATQKEATSVEPSARPPEAKPVAPPKTKKAEPSAQLPLMDYGLYKCLACGKMVLGFSKAEHVKEVHQGVEPKWEKKR